MTYVFEWRAAGQAPNRQRFTLEMDHELTIGRIERRDREGWRAQVLFEPERNLETFGAAKAYVEHRISEEMRDEIARGDRIEFK